MTCLNQGGSMEEVMLIGFWIHSGSRVNRIYWCIGPEVKGKESRLIPESGCAFTEIAMTGRGAGFGVGWGDVQWGWVIKVCGSLTCEGLLELLGMTVSHRL